MKKYVIIILLIGIILGGILLYNTIKIEQESNQEFADSGYILQYSETQNIERYYFNANDTYKTKYDEKILFNNTDGDEVTAEKNNFIHYSDGSVSAFTNGVILNLDEIDKDPIQYYNISASSVLKREGEYYTIENLDQKLNFSNVIWKIDSNKYIILSNDIKLVFNDDEEDIREISGYVEFEYLDNEIVKIYNQEATYQTISSRAYVELPNDIKITLSTKIVSKNNDNKMSLENMIIDSDDNITIVDLSQYETDEDEEENTMNEENTVDNGQTNGSTGGQTVNNNSSNTNNNSTQTIIGGGTIGNAGDTGNTVTGGTENPGTSTGENTVIEGNDIGTNIPAEIVEEPQFKVERFDVNSIGFDATITVQDDDNTLIDDYNIYILQNSTGKTVYQNVESSGVYSIDITVATLVPNTEYTLVVESTYAIDDITYTKNFIYKIFKTSVIGIDVEKDLFTDTSLGLALTVNKDTQVKSVDVVLSDMAGATLQTQTVNIVADASGDSKNLVEFNGLTSNTQYVVSLTNALYDGQILTNGYIESKTYTTLKAKPTISGAGYEINKRDGSFALKLTNVNDPDGGIQKYTFKIYDTRITDSDEPVKIIESTSPTTTLNVDGEDIVRNVGYTYKVVVEFYDNEKIFEYESEFSNVMTIDGVGFPTIRFESDEVTFERIVGNIIVDDEGKAIDLENNEFVIMYTDSTGNIQSFTSSGSYTIPVDVNNLRANETYRFSIYATIDLKDGNDPIDECYIGGFTVQTDTPKNMIATFDENDNDVQNVFSVDLGLEKETETQGTLEPETLTGMTISIYAGQTLDGEYPTGSPLRTIKLVDSNLDPYVSDLKEQFFDNITTITPAFFNANNDDFKDAYYTITVTSAYDYTTYENQLPILNNVYTVETNGYMPDLPTDTNNALTVTAIRNFTQETPREDLAESTIVGYTVKATYDNSGLYARKVIYKAYDANTDALIETQEIEIGSDGVIPEAIFNVLDGTPLDTQDTDALRRGNSYYFTYEMLLDLNNDGEPETHYPYEEDDVVLKSATQTPQKQEPNMYLYPKISTNNSITFKYQFNDVDNAVGNNNQVVAKINNATLWQINMIETGEDFEETTFENLREGQLTLTLSKCLVKENGLSDYTFLSQYFESQNSITGLTYRLSYDANKLSINFSDSFDVLKYVTAIRVELIAQSDPENKVVKDFQVIPNNNIISINYNELGSLLKETTTVNVYAYYDSGIVGYETDSQKYVTYQQAYENADDDIYYYDINDTSNLVQDTEAMGNIYTSSRNENVLTLLNKSTGRTSIVELTYSEEGFLYQGIALLPKQIDEAPVTCSDENNTIYFDLIIPGISLMDDNGNWQIVTELDNATIKAELLIDPETEIVDNKIYIDLYQTDSNYQSGVFVKTIEVGIEEFEQEIQIEELQPQAYYSIKFRTIVNNDDNMQEEVDLYDLDYQVSGRSYYFSTLADVGINDIQINYEPVKYEEKYIDISYTLERTSGYDRIEYKLYHYNEEAQDYDEVMEGISIDQIFTSTMNKQIAINPGSEFIFGDKYKLEIIPIAEYENLDGELETLKLGAKEQEFTFQKLGDPIIAISGTRQENNEIDFKITIYDDDRVVVGNEYTVRVYNAQLEEITPDEYKNVPFSVDTINNTITIANAENEQAYTILVVAKLDKNNSSIEDEYEESTKRYTVPEVNEFGISIGDVTINKNSQDSQKIDILFNNSYRLNEIDTISYTIYNTSGYSRNGQATFIPTQVTSGEETYYTYTIDERLTEYGKYYIELQFMKEGQLVENITMEYINLET